MAKKIEKICLQCQDYFFPSTELTIKEREGAKFCCYQCYWVYRKENKMYPPSQIGKTPWNKGIEFTAIKGDKNHNWKGGITKENNKIRQSIEYKLWKEAVFSRDDYTCIWCGQTGGELNADHIKPFCDYPELRFAIDNGRTLCLSCHKKTPTYGGRKKCL